MTIREAQLGKTKDINHEIRVSSWNINKSSARYDFLRDVAQLQVDVAMFQETQNWYEDGAVAVVGWSLFHLEKERKQLPQERRR